MQKRKRIAAIFTFVAALAAVAYLVSGFDDTVVYYKTVDELLAEPTRFETRPVRINGRLVPGSVKAKPGSNSYRFQLVKRQQTVEVFYEGILPDTMAEGQDLVAQGTFDAGSRRFNATEILTKCPSKYEATADAIE